MVDDGSTDGTSEVAAGLRDRLPALGVFTLRRNFGKSAALNTGFNHAAGAFVVTMDADLQDDPAEIPLLLEELESKRLDLVSGWKRKRHDPLTKTIPSLLQSRDVVDDRHPPARLQLRPQGVSPRGGRASGRALR
ncbi:MAG: glycosyltransferase [Candidatus Eisenbacteria bacterium]